MVPALADCGIRYVIVDDYHFLCAGKTAAELDGYFTTEEDGRKLDLFPISEALRYRLPFSPADEAVAYIESLAENSTAGEGNAAIYFDDIEKFGIWPETYQWVYEKGWLDQFIQGVLASPMIRTQHYRDYHAAEKTRGVVYLPTTSYIEMNEWTLPAQPANIYADLVQQAKTAGWYEGNKAFLRGGIWRNFFSRYPESNWMHKRMLGLSARLASLPERQHTVAMKVSSMSPKPMMHIGMACLAACIYLICGARYLKPSSSWKRCSMLAPPARHDLWKIPISTGRGNVFAERYNPGGAEAGWTAAVFANWIPIC